MKAPQPSKYLSPFVELHEDYYGEHFSSEVKCKLDVYVDGSSLLDGLSYREKAKVCRSLGKYLLRVADFFDRVRKQGHYKQARLSND